MRKTRVYELAKKLKITTRELIDDLTELDVKVKNHMSTLDDETVNIILGIYETETKTTKEVKPEKSKLKPKEIDRDEADKIETEKKRKAAKKKEEEKAQENVLRLKGSDLRLDNLSSKLDIPPAKIIKDQFIKGVVLRPGQAISLEDARQIASEYGWTIELELEEYADPYAKLKKTFEDLYAEEYRLIQRPPIVTVMGHVDHGKTTLLDNLRKAHVADQEVGGITQSIGAYQIEQNSKKITFIDTPGHEAFTEMRARGAQATDIVILVVAADDGVMPQTIEAYNHAKTAKVPIVVAINKIDKPNANIDMTKQQLASKLGLVPEDWGGDTIAVPISAKTGEGVDDLLEMILLVAEMSDIKGLPDGAARGIIIESELDKAKGPLATAIVKDGILKTGDFMVAGSANGKVRALSDEKGKRLKEAGPSEPVQILGFNDVPNVHGVLYAVDSLQAAREISQYATEEKDRQKAISAPRHVRLEEFMARAGESAQKELNLILKSESFGTVEALKQAIGKLQTEEVRINVVHSGIGSVNSNDVLLAAASDAVVIGFRVRPDAQARSHAETEDVQIRIYEIIFDLIDDIKKALEGLLEPEEVEETTGKGEVRKLFKIGKLGTIAGVQLTEGYVTGSAYIRVYRKDKELFDGEIENLKHYKDEVKRVEAPKECGIKIQGFDDLEVDDRLEFRVKKQVRRTLDFQK